MIEASLAADGQKTLPIYRSHALITQLIAQVTCCFDWFCCSAHEVSHSLKTASDSFIMKCVTQQLISTELYIGSRKIIILLTLRGPGAVVDYSLSESCMAHHSLSELYCTFFIMPSRVAEYCESNSSITCKWVGISRLTQVLHCVKPHFIYATLE